jgi:hypothetical protein
MSRHLTPSPHLTSRHQRLRQGQQLRGRKPPSPSSTAPWQQSTSLCLWLSRRWEHGGLRQLRLSLNWAGEWQQSRGIFERLHSSVSVSRWPSSAATLLPAEAPYRGWLSEAPEPRGQWGHLPSPPALAVWGQGGREMSFLVPA